MSTLRQGFQNPQRLKEVHKVDQLQLILKFFLGRASSDYDLTLHVVLHVTFWYLSSKSKVWKKGGCWYISQMDPSTLDAFSVELTHPLQKLWEKIMDKYMDKDSTVAIWQRLVFAGGIFFLVNLGPGVAVSGMRIEINTGHSCCMISNSSRMALQSSTVSNTVKVYNWQRFI